MGLWSELDSWKALKRYMTALADMSPHCTVYPNAEVVSFVEENIARLKLLAAEEKRDEAEASKPNAAKCEALKPDVSEPVELNDLQELDDRIDRLQRKHIHLISTDNTLRLDIGNVKKRLDRLEACSEPKELQKLHDRINRLKHRAGFDRGRAYEASSKADARLDRLEAWADKLTEWSDKHHYALTRAPMFADDAHAR